MINNLQSQLALITSELQRERERGEKELVIAELVLKAQERQIRDEETISELKQRLERTEAEARSAESSNRLLAEKNEEYKANSASMQETIRGLRENNEAAANWISETKQTVAKLITCNGQLEAAMVCRDNQLHCLSQEWETLQEQVARDEETILKKKLEAEQKMQEANAWRELFYYSGSTAQHRRRHNSSMPSIVDMLVEKDETIEELKHRLSVCICLLSVCSCNPIYLTEAPLLVPIPDKGTMRPVTYT
jgi:chromosome segregation ATPase